MSRHRLDVTSLSLGVIFVVTAVLYLVADVRGWSIDVRWVVPVLFIGLGVGGLAGAITNLVAAREPSDATPTPPAD